MKTNRESEAANDGKNGGAPAKIVEVRGLSKTFGAGRRAVAALKDVSFDVAQGEIVGLLGPDGAGKTTLIRALCSLSRPTAGNARVCGFDVVRNASDVQREIGYVPQQFGLYETLTVGENLRLYAKLRGTTPAEQAERIPRLLELTRLERFVDRRAGKLSGGMKQKLALACALVGRPKLLALDEPTVGVDVLARRELWTLLREIVKREGTTALVSTSYMDEADFCDRTLVLFDGKLLADSTPAAIRATAAPFVRARNEKFSATGAKDGSATDLAPDSTTDLSTAPAASSTFEEGFQVLLTGGVFEPLQRSRSPAPDAPVAIRVENLTKRFGSFVAVDDVSFDVRRGEIFGLLGANGAGKTTTFRALCALSPADSGRIEIAGFDLAKDTRAAWSRIGYVAQKFSLYSDLTVLQNLSFFGGAYGLRGAKKRARVDWALKTFGLEPFADRDAGKLPVGGQRRLATAAALLHEPEILFLDEATSGADSAARRDFWRLIIELADSGVSVVVTTHYLDEAAYCDRLVVMRDGVAVASGTVDDVVRQSGGAPNLEEAFVKIVKKGEKEERR